MRTSMVLLWLGLCCGCQETTLPLSDGMVDGGPSDGEVGEGRLDGELPDAFGGDVGVGPGSAFSRYCGSTAWYTSTMAATVEKLSGKYSGFLTGVSPTQPFAAWSLETVKVIPPHPFWAKKIRVAFASGTGKARIRLMTTFGRSAPGPFPNITSEAKDLIKPVTVDVKKADPNTWLEIDISKERLFLHPTKHYMIVYQHLTAAPYLAIEEVPTGEHPRSYFWVPTSVQTWGLANGGKNFNYRMELSGETFCHIADSRRWFAEDRSQPFASVSTVRMAIADINNDGKDDLVVNSTRTVGSAKLSWPSAFLGDGKGGFVKPTTDPFPDAKAASLVLFADVDNDGDRDAAALTYINADNDDDKATVYGAKPDCNDADDKIYPGATEVTNGYDDDCDGVADDGKDTNDGDKDGYSIAKGDCDDTRKDVYPGAPELLDKRDNDCDRIVDEDFANRFLINDGKGVFKTKTTSGIEALDPSTAAAFADANGDGKLDLYWGNWLIKYPKEPAVQDRFMLGKGDGTFVDMRDKAGMKLKQAYSVYGVRWFDYNNDGRQDLYVSNYHRYPNQLWENRGNGTFVDVAENKKVAFDAFPTSAGMQNLGMTGGHSYGMDFGDVDNDGDMDMFVTNLSHPRARPSSDPSVFVVNGGAPNFSFLDKTQKTGFIYDEGDVNVAMGDMDNDGDLDLAVASLYTGHYSRIYRNDGAAGFVDVTYESGARIHDAVGVLWHDVEGDGDLDLLLVGRATESRHVHLFKNTGKFPGSWVEILLQGTTSNRDGVGARVTVTAGGVKRIRDARGGGGGHANTQASRVIHLGLGKATAVDSVTVRWVGGKSETISGVKPNGRYRIVEGTGKAAPL